jgi:ubiquinone/menaquinone biosynthesis C-methylase UbiE
MGTAPDRDSTAAVRDYYERFAGREAQRLDAADDGAVERALHARALAEFLPPPPARVLDIGGGPGAWTLWLAERGYQAVLADLSPALLDIARSRVTELPPQHAENVAAIVEADARDLSAFDDGSFDAVLCLGPFYHLTAGADRDRAASEAHRVLRPGGVLAVAVMPRYMRLLATVLERGSAAFDDGTVHLILDGGRYDDERPGRFTGGYLVRPGDVAPFFDRHGFSAKRLMASQGFLGSAQSDVAGLARRDPRAHQHLLDLAYATAADPSILGMAAHLLFVGERRR